jgi:beta-galactosidase
MMHRSVLGLLALAAVPFAVTHTTRPAAEPSCVAHWRFQDGVRDVPAGQNRVMQDASGHDQNGLAIGGPVYRRVDLPGGNLALEFGSDPARVFVPDDEAFELTGSLTLEAWARVDRYTASPGHPSYFVFRGDDRPGFDPWFLGVAESGQLVFVLTDELGRTAVVASPAPLPLGRFVHVAGTFDAEAGLLSVFVDGERVATSDTSIRPLGTLGGPNPGIGIGRLQSGGGTRFDGLIAEVRICAAALPRERMLR